MHQYLRGSVDTAQKGFQFPSQSPSPSTGHMLLSFFPECQILSKLSPTHLWKMPWDATVLLLSLLDPTLQPTVGECVALVELQVALVGEEAATSLWRDVPDVVGGDDLGGEVDEVLPSWLHMETLVPHHRELSGLADEQLERVVLLVLSSQGN